MPSLFNRCNYTLRDSTFVIGKGVRFKGLHWRGEQYFGTWHLLSAEGKCLWTSQLSKRGPLFRTSHLFLAIGS